VPDVVLAEAASAAERDRPDAYDAYVVGDLAAPTPEMRATLARYRFGVLATVAALGYGDIPPQAFAAGYELLAPGGWLAFCIKEDFLADDEPSGFAQLIGELLDAGELEIVAERRYRHRLSAEGEPLHYIAQIARKRASGVL
jgi:hypothetical protein